MQINIKISNLSQKPSASSKVPNQDFRGRDSFFTFKNQDRAKIQNIGLPKTSDHIQIKVMMPNSSQEPLASSKAPNQDLKDINVLCTFKIKKDS